MSFLRGLAIGGQAYTEAKARERARQDALDQQAFQRALQQQAMELQRQQLSGQEKQQEFYRGLAREQQDWAKGAPGRALDALARELELRRQDAAAMSSQSLREIALEALGQVPYAGTTAPPQLAAKRAILETGLPGALQQPGASAPAAPEPSGHWSVTPGQEPEFIQPPAPAATVPVAGSTPPPVRLKAKRQGVGPRTTFQQPDLPLANDAELRRLLKDVPGFGVTGGPSGTTYQYRPATEGERASTAHIKTQTQGLQQQLVQDSLFLPFKLLAADMANQLSVIDIGLKNFALSQTPAEAERQRLELQKLYTTLDQAKELHPLEVERLQAQIKYTLAQTAAVPVQLGQAQQALDIRASAASTGDGGSATTSGGITPGQDLAERKFAYQVWKDSQTPTVKPPTQSEQMRVISYLQSSAGSLLERERLATIGAGTPPSLKEIDAKLAEITAYSGGPVSGGATGIIPRESGRALYESLLQARQAAIVREYGTPAAPTTQQGAQGFLQRLFRGVQPQQPITTPSPSRARAKARPGS